jgi:glycosyltransferase involved in cell wall biosynthesis
MSILVNGFIGATPIKSLGRQAGKLSTAGRNGHHVLPPPPRPDAEFLRQCAWEIGEARSADQFVPEVTHVGLAPVSPYQGFAHWRIPQSWVDETARQKGDVWRDCRLVLRLYDVSCIEFNGLNAHHIQDQPMPALFGQLFFRLPRPGTWQLAEAGFLLRNGEFVPAARSQAVPFPPDSASSRHHQGGLLVDGHRVEEIGNVWDQERILTERRQPRLRRLLRTAAFAFASRASGQEGWLATFVSELAAGQAAAGHEAHVFVPARDSFTACRDDAGVHYHPLEVSLEGSPPEQAQAFAQAAEKCLRDAPAFDLIHLHEWMTGLGGWYGATPSILSLSSIEATRRGDVPATELSRAIEEAEGETARKVACVLTPAWLREKARFELSLNGSHVHAFPMEGRMPNEWEAPLDFGQVKMGIGLGPLDRLLLFVGPLEHGAGIDLLLEALPVLLQRASNVRLVFAGAGDLYGQLHHRAHQLGVAGAVRILGHVDSSHVTRLMRSAEALVLPSRHRVPFDDAVVDLARRAGRPVVTTHGGPTHLVRHEENGIVTYDNPGSLVWALDRILGDPAHAERMGQNARRHENSSVMWSEVVRHYLDLCATEFPELTE